MIRRLCQHCRQPYDCNQQTARQFRLQAGETLYRPGACSECRETGYRGRVGIFEVIRITNEISKLIQTRASLPELRREATRLGMKLLRDSALEKVHQGTTSLEEALSVTTDPGEKSWETVLDSLSDALSEHEEEPDGV